MASRTPGYHRAEEGSRGVRINLGLGIYVYDRLAAGLDDPAGICSRVAVESPSHGDDVVIVHPDRAAGRHGLIGIIASYMARDEVPCMWVAKKFIQVIMNAAGLRVAVSDEVLGTWYLRLSTQRSPTAVCVLIA